MNPPYIVKVIIFILREKWWDLTRSYGKSPYTDRKSKKQRDNTKTTPKTSITLRLRTDLGRSVGATVTTKLELLNRFTGSQPSHLPQKPCNQKIYKDLRQSRLCSSRLEASSGPRTKGVPTNNQRGRGSGPCLLWVGLDKSSYIVPTALLVGVQCFRKDLYKAVEWPSTRPIVLSMITGPYFRRRRRLTILEPDETKFASPLTHLSL